MSERNLLAVSIKHTEYGWKFGMPCWLWGHRTPDGEKRSWGGYTQYPNNAELYSLAEWQASGYGVGDICKVDEPVHMKIGFCRKWRKYDTVLVPYEEYIYYCKAACLPMDRPKEVEAMKGEHRNTCVIGCENCKCNTCRNDTNTLQRCCYRIWGDAHCPVDNCPHYEPDDEDNN